MNVSYCQLLAVALVLTLVACDQKKESEVLAPISTSSDAALFSVGSLEVFQSDLDHYLQERHEGRNDASTQKIALAELVERAQYAQAAKDSNLENDPIVRAEFARILATRYKEKSLHPQVKAIADQEISEKRLKEIYQQNLDRFASPEKRQVAVLWLNPNRNPERQKQYVEKLNSARKWFSENPSVKDDPDQGFSVLSVDHSEHAASRYKGGVVGWLQAAGGFDAFSKAVADIAFGIEHDGAVSDVVVRDEGVFLVRLMKRQVGSHRSFESVKTELKHAEQQRLRAVAEKNFKETVEKMHPVKWLQPSPETKP